MKKTWQVVKSDHYLRDTSADIPILPKGVYNLQQTPLGELYLQKMSDEFTFDFKVYGLEEIFIKRVLKTYKETKGNMGVLLNGQKGTGKTITAEIIANKLELPIILVSTNYPGLNNFLMEIIQNVVVFIDEYEKIFKGTIDEEDYSNDGDVRSDSTLLGIMDGAYKTIHRKVFILTTNRMYINENLLNRPGRIRYKKDFNDLSLAEINEIVDDCLKYKEFREDVINYLKPLKLITVDIVKAVISQVNIFKTTPEDSCKNLNVQLKEETYTIYKIKANGKKELITENMENHEVAHIVNIGKSNWRGRTITLHGEEFYVTKFPNKGIYTVNPNYGSWDGTHAKDNFTIEIKKTPSVHRVFYGY